MQKTFTATKRNPMQLEATELRPGRWAVKPLDQLGTCGFYPVAWTVHYVNAKTAGDAVRKTITAHL